MDKFPSLSGKTFIRTTLGWAFVKDQRVFPSLSGKTFIRTWIFLDEVRVIPESVSIPFREDLHSDFLVRAGEEITIITAFPSLSGKTFIRTYQQC